MGKSLFVLQAAVALSAGADFLGHKGPAVPVLFYSTEIDAAGMKERLIKNGVPATRNLDFKFSILNGQAGLDDIEQRIIEKGYKVVVIDMLLPLIPTDARDLNSYENGNFYLALRRIGQRHGVAIVATWHARKSEAKEDWLDGAMSSMSLVGQSDVVINIDRKRGQAQARVLIESNHSESRVISAYFQGCKFVFTGESAPEDENSLTAGQENINSPSEIPGRGEGRTNSKRPAR
jgi:RecA-family ATPase